MKRAMKSSVPGRERDDCQVDVQTLWTQPRVITTILNNQDCLDAKTTGLTRERGKASTSAVILVAFELKT